MIHFLPSFIADLWEILPSDFSYIVEDPYIQ